MIEPQPPNIQLTQEGILYMSSGFDGPYILQIISSKYVSPKQYHLCLTDGRLYIGGRYQTTKKIELGMYNIVKISCKFVSRWVPIQIQSLEIVSNSVPYLLGKPPTTLYEYFQEQKQNNLTSHPSVSDRSEESYSSISEITKNNNPRKKVKLSSQNQDDKSQHEQSLLANNIETQTQKISGKPVENAMLSLQNQSIQPTKFKFGSQIVSYRQQSKQIPFQAQEINSNGISSQSEFNNETIPLHNLPQQTQTQTQPKIYYAQEQEVIILEKTKTKKIQNFNTKIYTNISDLYQRMMRWKILCRVINLRKFISAKGKKCISMYLIDQKGDAIKAMYYYDNKENTYADSLEEGKVYSLSGGEVHQSSAQEAANLEITLDYKCKIQQQAQTYIYPFAARKLSKFKDLPYKNQQVQLIGILKQYEIISPQSTSYKSKPKLKGILCNPIQLVQIEFSKTFYEGQPQPKLQEIYVLVNFNPVESQNAFKLSSTLRGYLVQITKQDLQLKAPRLQQYQQLKKFRQQIGPDYQQYKKLQYTNLSQVKYSKRAISQMKTIALENDCAVYSQILVSIADIKLKKQYMACPICKKGTIKQQSLYQCLRCRKIVEPTPTLIINLLLADGTGSFEIDVIGDKVHTFIGIETSQFNGMSSQEKQCTLQIAKFSQFVVKIKTEKKSFKELSHILQEVNKQQLNITMKQIRRRTVEKKLKLQQKWDLQD